MTHAFGRGTVTLVCLSYHGQKIELSKPIRIHGPSEIERYFALDQQGKPVVGKNVYRVMSRKERAFKGLSDSSPLCGLVSMATGELLVA